MSKRKVVLVTFLVWFFGTGLYYYHLLASAFAAAPASGYESDPYFILIGTTIGFFIYRGVYLLIGMVVVVWVELMLFETVFRKS